MLANTNKAPKQAGVENSTGTTAFIRSPFRTDNIHVYGDVWILLRLFVKNAWISQLIGLPN